MLDQIINNFYHDNQSAFYLATMNTNKMDHIYNIYHILRNDNKWNQSRLIMKQSDCGNPVFVFFRN